MRRQMVTTMYNNNNYSTKIRRISLRYIPFDIGGLECLRRKLALDMGSGRWL